MGSRLVHFLSHLVFLFPLRRYLGCSLGKEAEAKKGYRSKVTKQGGGRACIRIQVSLTSQLLFILSAYLPFSQQVEESVSIEKQRPRGIWGKHTYVFLPATAPRGNSFHRGGLTGKAQDWQGERQRRRHLPSHIL